MSFAALHESPWKGVIYAAGGSLLISDLLTQPGGSNTVILASVPYARSALDGLLGYQPDQACSSETSTGLARGAWQKAQTLEPGNSHIFGLGLTASLSTSRPKRGDHRVFISLHTQVRTWTWHYMLEKGQLSRLEEERLIADIAADNLVAALGLKQRDNPSTEKTEGAPAVLERLMKREVSTLGRHGTAFLPGSFNPLHEGHVQIKEIAERKLGTAVQFELCIENVDKPPLDYVEVACRQAQFEPDELILTNEPRFFGKAGVLSQGNGCTFVVGTDTFARIVNPKYYEDGTESARDAALQNMKQLGCRFLVFGRYDGTEFVTLANLDVPEFFADCVQGVAEDEFRNDISSTAIRARTR